jgi:hypothetical protein
MNNRSLLRVFAGLALLCTLGGCASLSKSECLNADWEDIGIRDGASGRGEEYLIQHSTACAKVNVQPDRARWLKGREQGLDRFCVPQRMYNIGEYGGGFDIGVCRNYDQDRLMNAYQRGRDVNRLSGELGAIDTEMREIGAALERKDLESKERERLAFRLGLLVAQRSEAARALEDARYRARDL